MSIKKNTEPDNKGGDKKEETPRVNTADVLEQLLALKEELANLKKTSPPTVFPGKFSEEDIASIAAIIASRQKPSGPQRDINYDEGIEEEDIPTEDWDPKGVRFCCPLVGYLIQDDLRKGHRIKLPYNKKEVFFEYAATRVTQVGKYEQAAPLSVFRSHSHKLTKWLREHSLYGIMFYETSNEAMNADASKALRMASIMKALQPLELHDLFRRCKEYGVEMSEDAAVMRGKIAYAMISKEIESEADRSKAILDDNYKSSVLLGRE
jgi:hypothetical protein